MINAENKNMKIKIDSVLFIGGLAPHPSYVKTHIKQAERIVAADSGIYTAQKYNIEPHLIIGDMDSIEDESILKEYPKAKVLRYGKEKDYTDTELGLKILQEEGYNNVCLIGGGGGRTDHLLALCRNFNRSYHPVVWFTHNTMAVPVHETYQFESKKNEVISVFPLGTEIVHAESKGLRWNLDDIPMNQKNYGISNYTVEDVVSIHVLSGRIIVFRNFTWEKSNE